MVENKSRNHLKRTDSSGVVYSCCTYQAYACGKDAFYRPEVFRRWKKKSLRVCKEEGSIGYRLGIDPYSPYRPFFSSLAEKKKLLKEGFLLLMIFASVVSSGAVTAHYLENKQPEDFPNDVQSKAVLKCVQKHVAAFVGEVKEIITR